MVYDILAVNPGSTSTKIAVFRNRQEMFREDIEHDPAFLDSHPDIEEQFPFRRDMVLACLEAHSYQVEQLSAVVGRGGLLPPVKAGGYTVNQAMKDRILKGPISPHASNMGALIADAVAAPLGIPAYIYDAVSSDEFMEISRITGIPEVVRQSFCHVLNSKAMARKAAEEAGKSYEEMNFLVAHMGGGISFSAHRHGKIVDALSDDGGAFSPQRSGSVPIIYIVDMCYSGKYTKAELMRKIRGDGGLKAYLGTYDCREIEKMIRQGNEKAELLYEAQAYQVAKGIGQLAPALKGNVDAIILTGGMAHSKMLTDWITDYIDFLGPVRIMPGEMELEALAYGALRILQGQEKANIYRDALYG